MLDEIENMKLLLMVKKRLPYDSDKMVNKESVMRELGISQAEIDNMEDVEIE